MLHRRLASIVLLASTSCGGGSAPIPPDPPSPQPLAIDDRPPMQIAVDPDPVTDPPPSRRPIATSCGSPPITSRLGSCSILIPSRAAATGRSSTAESAFDGSTCSVWNAGGFAPQSIMVDLGEPRWIDGVVLVPEMSPNGPVVHRIELSDRDDPRSFQSAHRIEASMSTGVPVELPFPRAERARFVQIATEASPSWVAWREIVILGCQPARR